MSDIFPFSGYIESTKSQEADRELTNVLLSRTERLHFVLDNAQVTE
jgi:hypothetical protein